MRKTMSYYNSEVEVTQHLAVRPPPLSLGINVEKPKFPQYAVYAKRLESFRDWPEYLPIDKKDLVEAGLVYTGVGDSVRCYFCGEGLRNWEYGDVPMEEHAKWYPNCPHILLVKGQAYAEKVSRGEKTDVYDATNKQQDSVDEVDNIESEAAQSCIEIGYSEQMVRKPINILIQRHGKRHFKGKDICEILFDIEANPEDFDDVCVLSEETKHKSCEKDTKSATEETESLERLLEENHKLKENQMCKICLDSRADVIFLPCGHMLSTVCTGSYQMSYMQEKHQRTNKSFLLYKIKFDS